MKLPSSFTDYTRALLGVEEYEKLAAALEGEQPVSIRLNEDKLPESSFSLFRSSLEHVPWSAAGYYLDKRLTFTFDPLFQDRKSTRLNSSHASKSRMPSSA